MPHLCIILYTVQVSRPAGVIERGPGERAESGRRGKREKTRGHYLLRTEHELELTLSCQVIQTMAVANDVKVSLV